MKRWERPGAIRFITFSCQDRLPLLGNPAIRDLFVDIMVTTKRKHDFELFAWVVMPEHVHLLMRPHESVPLDQPLRSLKTSVAKRVVGRWRELDAPILREIHTDDETRFWQKGGGFDRCVRDTDEFCREVPYIHRNPVKRGLVERPEQWQWSSVRWWMGKREDEIECDPPPGDPRSWTRWTGYV